MSSSADSALPTRYARSAAFQLSPVIQPRTVATVSVTSKGSAAWHDFHDELVRSGFGFQVEVCHTRVQGDGAEFSVAAAIRTLVRRSGLDCVVVIRGGGARNELATFDAAMVLDVLNKTEHADGHIPGSAQLSGGRVLWNLDQLPTDGTIVTYCQSGVRNSVAASALRRAGYRVVELEGSYAAWSERNLVTA